MPESTKDATAVLRQAAQAAPTVLPTMIGELVAWYLNGTADSGEMWPTAPVLAAEVLALAEHQQASGEMRQLLVAHQSAWDGIIGFLEGRGLNVFPIPVEGDFPSYGIGVSDELMARSKAEGTRVQSDVTVRARAWRVGDDPGVDRGLMVDAAQYVISHQHASSSAVQRNVRVGFAKAMRLLDLLETWGVIGPSRGSLARVVLVPKEQRADVLAAIKGDASA